MSDNNNDSSKEGPEQNGADVGRDIFVDMAMRMTGLQTPALNGKEAGYRLPADFRVAYISLINECIGHMKGDGISPSDVFHSLAVGASFAVGLRAKNPQEWNE